MRFIKILIQAIIFLGLLLIIIQNESVFTKEFQLGLDLEIWSSGTFVVKNIILIASAFLLGVILTVFWGAFSSVGKSSTIKQQKKKIKELEKSAPVSTSSDSGSSSYSASETVSSEPHEVPSQTSSDDPFKSPN